MDLFFVAKDGLAPLVGLTIESFLPVAATCAGGRVVIAVSTLLRRTTSGESMATLADAPGLVTFTVTLERRGLPTAGAPERFSILRASGKISTCVRH